MIMIATTEYSRILEMIEGARSLVSGLKSKDVQEPSLYSLDGAKGVCAVNMYIRNGMVYISDIDGDKSVIKINAKNKNVCDAFGVKQEFVTDILDRMKQDKFIYMRKSFKGVNYHSMLFYVDSTHLREILVRDEGN